MAAKRKHGWAAAEGPHHCKIDVPLQVQYIEPIALVFVTRGGKSGAPMAMRKLRRWFLLLRPQPLWPLGDSGPCGQSESDKDSQVSGAALVCPVLYVHRRNERRATNLVPGL